MKILYLNTPVYDYATATLIEGLNELGHTVGCAFASNYGMALAEGDITSFGNSADLIVVGSGNSVPHHLLKQIDNPRVVAVDGGDHAAFNLPPGLTFKAIFKRELCSADRAHNRAHIFPLPFAAEKRYFTAPTAKDIHVSFIASMDTNPMRHSIHVRLTNRNDPRIFSGNTNERTYFDDKPQGTPIETPAYYSRLARSRMSVNVPGRGYDCARFWEILAAKAMLLTYLPDIEIPDPFTDGVNYVTFQSLAEFDEKLSYYLAHPNRVSAIAEAGYQHLLAHHTTARRAAYFVENAMAAAAQPGAYQTTTRA